MKLLHNINDYIFENIPINPPEIGGILGSVDGVVCRAEMDRGTSKSKLCSYEPDVERLNQVIEMWMQDNITFSGIFHTHFYGVRTLSDGDIEYINSILNAMPETINKLYFPIVLPERKQMIAYVAIKNGKQIEIVEEEVEIL